MLIKLLLILSTSLETRIDCLSVLVSHNYKLNPARKISNNDFPTPSKNKPELKAGCHFLLY